MTRSKKKTEQKSERRRAQPVIADVILKSISGKSVVRALDAITPRDVKEYLPRREVLQAAERLLGEMGFQIRLVAETHITISGPRELFENTFRIRLADRLAPVFHPPTKERQPYVEPDKSITIPPSLSEIVEAISFPKPPIYFTSATPPAISYDHMEIPDDVARAMDAIKVHARGITGTGIRLVMVDTGFMTPMHPYYVGKGYDIQPVDSDAGDPSPLSDSYGHGTGIATCALAVAPGVTFIPVKNHPSSAAAFSRAVSLNPHIISCSWGVGTIYGAVIDPALQLVINNAIASGIVVLFACGNGGGVGWPGAEPAVISVGGAFLGPDDSIQASSYASSGTLYGAPRQVPDLCGITGQGPAGVLIALPTQPGSTVDTDFSLGTYPSGDGTTSSDGWVVASGTSSATPMVAGVVALMMQANPALIGDPSAVRLALNNSCVDVTSGSSATPEPAGPGQDLATGWGLVQAYRAIYPADVWIKDNPDSDIGLVPTHGRRPSWPPYTHWTSPDIKVFSAPLTSPAVDFDPTPAVNPVFGQENYVYLRIRNRGTQPATGVSVRLYYADPATYLIFPADWKDGQSGIASLGSLTVIGVATNLQTVSSVAAGGSVVLPEAFVWYPPDPTTATQTQTLPDGRVTGHFCLLARLESADDPIMVPGGTEASVINDNNIGMKNVSVYSAAASEMYYFSFLVRGGPVELELAQTDLWFDLSRLPRSSQVLLKLDSKCAAKARLIEAERTRNGIQFKGGKRPAGITSFSLRPNEKSLAKLTVKLPQKTRIGGYAISIQQKVDGKPVGGLTFVAKVTGH